MPKWFHLVSHRQWDRPSRTGREHTLHRWCRLRALPQTTFVNFDQTPPDDGIQTRDPHLGKVICNNFAASDFTHLPMFYWAFDLPELDRNLP
jgi:hypothetical protein